MMDLESRRPDVVRAVQMRRAGRGRPDGSEVGELAFQAFDLELERGAAGRHRMSSTLTMESCTCVETTSRSSVSSATSFNISMARPDFPLIACPVAAPPIWGGPHGSAM